MYLNLIDIKKNNLDLINQNAELKTQLTELTELKLENERLNKLFAFKQKTKMELHAAKVIGRDLSLDHSTILIDQGSEDGVVPGLAVMTIEGAVGHVFRTSLFNSQVMLITDRYSVVDGLVQRSRARGLVEGKTSNLCTLKYVNKSEDVQAGDIIVTSGLDSIFPKGLPIAVVEKVESRPYNITLDVTLKPVVDPNKLEEVFIVLSSKDENLEEGAQPQPESEPAQDNPGAEPGQTPTTQENTNKKQKADPQSDEAKKVAFKKDEDLYYMDFAFLRVMGI